MAVYKFRVTFEDFDDISRDIEIKAAQSFEALHTAIQTAIGFDASKPASFYMSDDNWKKGTEIALEAREGKTLPLMKDSLLCDFIIDPHQKIYYVFDYEAQWCFYIELMKILKEENVTYPRCVRTSGDAPKQKGVSILGTASTEFDFLDVAVMDAEEEQPEGIEGEPEEAVMAEDGEAEEPDEFSAEEHGEHGEHEEI